jgi:hypothetical protein
MAIPGSKRVTKLWSPRKPVKSKELQLQRKEESLGRPAVGGEYGQSTVCVLTRFLNRLKVIAARRGLC